MNNNVKFVEFVSANEAARKELEALRPELEGKSEQERADAFVKLAAKHGFTLTAEDFAAKMNELSEDELKAVAGGYVDTPCGEPFWNSVVKWKECGWCSTSLIWS